MGRGILGTVEWGTIPPPTPTLPHEGGGRAIPPHPNPPPRGGRESHSPPPQPFPHEGGGRAIPPHPNPPPRGGRESHSPPPQPSPTRGEGALFLPPPWWGRVGVGGNGAQFNRAQYNTPCSPADTGGFTPPA